MINNGSKILCEYAYLISFQITFKWIYPHFVLTICCLSSIFNVANIAVLSRPTMRTPTNRILMAIAVSDIILCLCQLPLIYSQNNPVHKQYILVLIYLMTSSIGLLTHTVSLWLGVVLALFRLLYIRLYPSHTARLYFGIPRAKLAILLTYAAWIVFLIPYLTTMRIKNIRHNATLYIPSRYKANLIIEKYAFWCMAIFGKIIPCLLILVLGILLLSTLRLAKRHHMMITSANATTTITTTTSTTAATYCTTSSAKRNQDHRRTTRILVCIILLTLPAELPTACLMVTSQIYPAVSCIYKYIGDVVDFISLLKNFIIFVLYCSMSSEYRHEFRKQFNLCLPTEYNTQNTPHRHIQPTDDKNLPVQLLPVHNNTNRRISGYDFSFFPKHSNDFIQTEL